MWDIRRWELKYQKCINWNEIKVNMQMTKKTDRDREENQVYKHKFFSLMSHDTTFYLMT